MSEIGGMERWVYRNREDLYREMGGVRFETYDFVSEGGVHHPVRVLRSRWFSLELSGSVTDFAENAVRRVLAVAGLAETPREAVDLVLNLSMREPELGGKMGELAKGLVLVMTKLNIVGEDGIFEIYRKQGEAEREILELALERMSKYCRDGGEIEAADIAAVLKECGMNQEDALKCLESGSFNFNGQAEEAVRVAYSVVEEGVR